MNRKEAFDQLYLLNGYPEELKEGLFNVFDRVFNSLYNRIVNDHKDAYVIDPDVVLNYVCQEHIFNLLPVNKEQREQVFANESYINRLVAILSDKIYINEFIADNNQALISEYHPLITTFQFVLNFILNKFNNLPKTNIKEDGILLDILKKGFVMCRGVINLLSEGYETEAFATWRTVHEVECIALILAKYPYVSERYIKHIEYARYYRNDNGNETHQDKLFEEVKLLMKEKNLKSKDTKKYIEYGWLYGIENIEEIYPEVKLNFRKGIQMVAELTSYSKLYETSSELAHSSPLLIYSNRDYFKSLALICIYETFFRLEDLFNKYLERNNSIDSTNYFSMRKDYLIEMKKNISIESVSYHLKYGKKNS